MCHGGLRDFAPQGPADRLCCQTRTPAQPTSSERSFGLADAWCLAELLGHVEMVLERRQRLAGPVLQCGIVAALGVALEQRHRVLMRADLVGVVVRAEIPARRALELVELALVRAVERRRKRRLHLAATDQALELAAGLGVIGHHLLRK